MKPRTQNEAARVAAIEQDSFDTTPEALAAADRVIALCAKYFPDNFQHERK